MKRNFLHPTKKKIVLFGIYKPCDFLTWSASHSHTAMQLISLVIWFGNISQYGAVLLSFPMLSSINDYPINNQFIE